MNWSTLISRSYCLEYCIFKVSLNISQCKCFNFVLTFQNYFGFSWCFLHFHINLKIKLSIFCIHWSDHMFYPLLWWIILIGFLSIKPTLNSQDWLPHHYNEFSFCIFIGFNLLMFSFKFFVAVFMRNISLWFSFPVVSLCIFEIKITLTS